MNTLRSLCIVLSVALGACSTRLSNAPVVDRSRPSGALLHPPVLQTVPPGYYRVQPGDTLYRIALDHGQHYLDVARWNHLPNPDQIEVNQLLRVVPPADEANAPAQTSIADADRAAAQTQPLNGVSAAPGTPLTLSSPAQPGPEAARADAPAERPQTQPSAPAAPGGIALAWPVRGPVLESFDQTKNKGINIGGEAGAPIQASAAGRVVYAGNGLRGYGHLIIVKHNATFLTAYAHNRKLFARENETVAQGQKIAEMGDSDANRVMLHFEVRKQGKPVDPLLYLPKP
ncbi:Putative outer membrane metallopeptidase lipoprotein nlpD; LysM Peptidoglycan-binding domain [Candidatus Glomeribacter gigasporarum BEG34]|uniref:Putative outer membrane metallopeptidase lipoprotein nlpD LysM Peptidoglycan-binding domain n=1 Tax=Candidatus Glomeribacter gigasporarum BEG34 TaxID=1070319 RepID=G2J9N9_9BURK|nr:peptidoglycan DD-metalloendopeptidase family protein [Candidatus Glomeribacter gigasporarum]CCD29486.1 Putative outer membrane metallopeptidase lipoprotein nlpD; LysM Peptidoglycan-binding domain [Candidatus Glomeribacter gigasporarum BEG34]